jgi:hypothetical protein
MLKVIVSRNETDSSRKALFLDITELVLFSTFVTKSNATHYVFMAFCIT